MIVDQSYWDNSYKNLPFVEANDAVSCFLDWFIFAYKKRKKQINSVFEVGFYPGRYLLHVSKKNKLVASGVDITSELDNRIDNWFKRNGVSIGDFFNCDAFKQIEELKKNKKKYDIVYSAGFIEHFENYLEVMEKHGDILKRGGLLIVTTPNFSGIIQKTLHYMFDKENYKRHVIPSMNPFEWKKTLEKNGYRVVYCGYYGGFDFWADIQKRGVFQKIGLKIVLFITPTLKKILNRSKRSYSPYCGIVAVKVHD